MEAEVCQAHDQRFDHDVALTAVPTGPLSDEAARKRFREEARVPSEKYRKVQA